MSADRIAPWPQARSAWECHVYIGLLPSQCGATGLEVTEQSESIVDGTRVWQFVAECPRCGESRSLAVRAPLGVDQPPPAFGGPEPSELIGPAGFLEIGERAAQRIPADPTEIDSDRQAHAYESIALAVAAVEEVLKFPPDRYDRREVLATLGAYQQVRGAYSRIVG